jgi:hypothetical protein
MMAGSYISYTLDIDEVVTREPIGVVQQIDIETVSVGTGQEIPAL